MRLESLGEEGGTRGYYLGNCDVSTRAYVI